MYYWYTVDVNWIYTKTKLQPQQTTRKKHTIKCEQFIFLTNTLRNAAKIYMFLSFIERLSSQGMVASKLTDTTWNVTCYIGKVTVKTFPRMQKAYLDKSILFYSNRPTELGLTFMNFCKLQWSTAPDRFIFFCYQFSLRRSAWC